MRFDTIISGGNIVDGTGEQEPFVADIGIQDDQIAAIGDLAKAETGHRISAEGQVVCPGFVDVHVHSEIALLGGRDQFAAVSQGCNDAFSSTGWLRMGTPTTRAGERIVALHTIRLWRCRIATQLADSRCLPQYIQGTHPGEPLPAGTTLCCPSRSDGMGSASGNRR